MTLTDEARKARIVITDWHILDGVQGDDLNCCLALAFADAGYPGVSVGMAYIHPPTCDSISPTLGHDETCVRMPEDMVRFQRLFDTDRWQVHKTEFTVTLPAGWPEPEW